MTSTTNYTFTAPGSTDGGWTINPGLTSYVYTNPTPITESTHAHFHAVLTSHMEWLTNQINHKVNAMVEIQKNIDALVTLAGQYPSVEISQDIQTNKDALDVLNLELTELEDDRDVMLNIKQQVKRYRERLLFKPQE